MSHRAAAIAAFGFIGLSVLGVWAGQQPSTPVPQGQPTFRADINYVELPVRVTDRKGNFVRDLKSSDFQIYEDGLQQEVASFRVIDLPLPDPKKPIVEPLAGTPAGKPFVLHEGESIDGRVYLFVLDDYHILPQYTFQVKSIVESFVKKQMAPQDIAAIVYTSVTRGQDFTNDRRALVSSLARFIGSLDALEPGGPQLVKSIAALDKIRSMSEALGRIHGRQKALVFISATLGCVAQQQYVGDIRSAEPQQRSVAAAPGYRSPSAPNTTPSRCFDSLWDAVRVATRANVNIYAFDPTTLASPGFVSPSIDGRGGVDAAMQKAQASETGTVRSFDGMRVLAQESGGFAMTNVNNFDKALTRIVREHSSYYLIGYYSTNDKPDGKTRRNAVALGRTDVQVAYRPTYSAPRH